MNLRTSVVIAVVMSCVIASAQDASDLELARLLANDSTRQSAVANIVASGGAKVPLLLSWTRTPPAQVDERGLHIGLADLFGQLKTKEAIPFLIKNISLPRSHRVNIWLKTEEAIEAHFPAVAGLVGIGPAASQSVIRASWEPMLAEDRLAAIFVVARIQDPEGRGFLLSALAEANMSRSFAERGLKRLDGRR